MKVKDLIAILQTMPQNIPVTGYNEQERTEEITKEGIRYFKQSEHSYFSVKGTKLYKEHVDIMGY